MSKNVGKIVSQKDNVIKMYVSGMGCTKIAKSLGVSESSVIKFLRKENIPIRTIHKSYQGSVFDVYKDQIVSLYQRYKSATKVAIQLSLSISTVIRCLRRCGYETKRQNINKELFLLSWQDIIVDLYKNKNKSIKYICSTINSGVSYRDVYKILIDNNIVVRSRPSRYIINKYFFDKINTENKAYILGLLYADGNIDKYGRGFSVYLQEDDKEILDKIKEILNYGGPLHFRKSKILDRKNQYGLNITNMYMTDALIRHNCVPKKSLVLTFPSYDVVPEYLLHHFMRGYFDGDGGIGSSFKNSKYGCVCIASSKSFLLSLQKFCWDRLGIESVIYYYDTRELAGNLTFNKVRCKKIFLDWIYNLSSESLYMNRKYKRYMKQYYNKDIINE